MENPKKILVIKLGALGDFMLSISAMQAIRKRHPDAHITLLTTKLFKDMAQRSRCFNDVWIDVRPKFYQIDEWIKLARRLNAGKFDFVYDLQSNDRTGFYYRLFAKKPQWFGTARGASHPVIETDEEKMAHAFTRQKNKFAKIGIDVGYPDMSFMRVDVSSFGIPKPYVLLIPGCAPAHPYKRWPALKYGALAIKLIREGYHVAAIGTNAERDVIDRILKSCSDVHDISGRTTFYDIASLAEEAAGAIGNDTGPTHIISLTGCPTLALFSGTTDPARSSPIGTQVSVLQKNDLMDLSVTEVLQAFQPREESKTDDENAFGRGGDDAAA